MMNRKLRFEDEKRSIIYYLCLIIPPVLIAGLSVMPPDFGSSIFWIAGGLYAAKSMMKLLYLIFFNLDRYGLRLQQWKERAKLLSEAAAVLVFLLALGSVKYSWAAAKRFAITTGEQIQQECRQSACPETLEGWEKQANRSFLWVGKCAKYALSYMPEGPDRFRLVLRQDIDRDFIVLGGKDRRLTTQHYPLSPAEETFDIGE